MSIIVYDRDVGWKQVMGPWNLGSNPLEVFYGKDVLKICIKYTVEHLY